MPDPSGVSIIPGVLSALRSLPLWVFVGLALAGYAVLFAPGFAGIDPATFRQECGVWVWVEAIGCSILGAARLVAGALAYYRSYRNRRASMRVLRFVPLNRQSWWHLAKQQDDSFVSQIRLDIQASNISDRPMQIVKVRLVRPRAEVIQEDALLPMEGSPYHSHRHAVPPHGTVAAGVHIMARGSLAAQGKGIRITVGLTDQIGEEYKIKNLRVATRDPPPQRRPLKDRLRDFQPFKWVTAKTEPPKLTPPWSFTPGFEYLDICKAVLSEEKRSYAANGRIRGGLGSFNVGLQSEPNKGWTTVGQIPQLLWEVGRAPLISSPNLDRLLAQYAALGQQDKYNLESYLLTQLQKDSQFSDVSYFVFLSLHRMGRTIDALQTARTFLAGEKVFGYSNLLGILAALVSCEHGSLDPQLYPQILDALPTDEHDFGIREKINLAKLQYLDRQRMAAGQPDVEACAAEEPSPHQATEDN